MRLLLLTGLIYCLGICQAVAQQAFFSLDRNMPVASGFNEIPDQSIIFEAGATRFVEMVAISTRNQVENAFAFYTATLPELGWAPASRKQWRRDNELLEFVTMGPRTYKLRLTPDKTLRD